MNNDFYYKKDRLNQLRGFCSTVQNDCSIRKASNKMKLEQSAISRQIMALERDLGVELFDRKSQYNKLALTESGKFLYSNSVDLIQGIDSLFQFFLKDINEEKNKKISVIAHHTCLTYLMPNYIKKFRERYNDVKFLTKVLPLNEALDELTNDDIDILLYPVDEKFPGFDYKLVYDLSPMIIMNKNNQLANKKGEDITFDDLSKQNFLMTEKSKIIHSFLDFCKNFNVSGDIEFQNISWESLRHYIKMDLGVHLYSELYNIFSIFKDPDIISKDVSHLFPRIKLYIIMKTKKIQPECVMSFIDMILNFSKIDCN